MIWMPTALEKLFRVRQTSAMIAMRTVLLIFGAILIAKTAWAGTSFPAKSVSAGAPTLLIYSSLDEAIALPLIEAFQDANPEVAIDYEELQTRDIYERIIQETDDAGVTADFAFSSAMDLQVKLVNDGYAAQLELAASASLPSWAIWRDAAFGVTFEPAVIVYHKPSFAGSEPPRTRAALGSLLKERADSLYGRIGTYDIERSGLGLFFLARDREHNRDIWSLVRAMGATGVKLYSNSSAILERVADGRFALGYNILGSYAESWAVRNPDLGIILPADYTVVMSRIGLVPEAARAPQLGARFLAYLISLEGQRVLARAARLPALHPELEGPNTVSELRHQYGTRLRPVPVGPGLLVYLDQVKRERLIREWNKALSAP